MVAVAAGALVLAALHVVGARLRFIHYVPRSRWLSVAGGISVAYVFLHLLPEVARGEEKFGQELALQSELGDELVWLIALAGLALFYGVEVAARSSRGEEKGETTTNNSVFVFSMASYAVYNFVIGYVLHKRQEEGLIALALFVAAIGLHFVVNDFALREHHKTAYRSVGRWLLVAAILLGAAVGAIADISEVLVMGAIAFIGGGIVLNVLKEELPTQFESRYGAFAAGVVVYGGLLLAV